MPAKPGTYAQRLPHRQAVEGAQFIQWFCLRAIHMCGQPHRQQHDGSHRDHRHRRVDPAPVDHLPRPRRQRIANQDRQGQTQHHQADRTTTTVWRTDRHRGQRGHAEVGAVRQPGDEAEQEQAAVTGAKRAGQVAQCIEAHQRQQQGLALPAGAQDGQQWRAHDHAQCIGADQVANLGFGHPQRSHHVRHQAHAGELAGADGKATQGQREQDQTNLARTEAGGLGGKGIREGN